MQPHLSLTSAPDEVSFVVLVTNCTCWRSVTRAWESYKATAQLEAVPLAVWGAVTNARQPIISHLSLGTLTQLQGKLIGELHLHVDLEYNLLCFLGSNR